MYKDVVRHNVQRNTHTNEVIAVMQGIQNLSILYENNLMRIHDCLLVSIKTVFITGAETYI